MTHFPQFTGGATHARYYVGFETAKNLSTPDYFAWRNSLTFFVISLLLFLGWPLVALISFSPAVFPSSYDAANTLYANVATYSHSMPAAGFVTTLIAFIGFFIYRGVSMVGPNAKHYQEEHIKELNHTSWLALCFPLYTAGLALWCYGHPWWTFGLDAGAYVAAMFSYMSCRGLLTVDDLSRGTLSDNPPAALLNKQGHSYNLVHAIFYKLPVKLLVVFLYFETLQAFFGAVTTTSHPDLAWDVRHWYTVFHCVVAIAFGTFYFTYLCCDAVMNLIFAGFFIQLALAQKAAIASFGYIWIVTYSFGFFEIIAAMFAGAYVLNVIQAPSITLAEKHKSG